MLWQIGIKWCTSNGEEYIRWTSVEVNADGETQALELGIKELPGYGSFLRARPKESPDAIR